MARPGRRPGQGGDDDSHGGRRSGRHRGSEDRAVAGAGGVVFNPRGEVLLLKHASGSWVFPKGHIEPGEDPLETAVREIEEEAGVDARCDDPGTSWTTRYRNARGEMRQITWYRMDTRAQTPVLRERLFPDGAFLPAEEAARRLSFQEDRRLLSRVLEAAGDGSAGGGGVVPSQGHGAGGGERDRGGGDR